MSPSLRRRLVFSLLLLLATVLLALGFAWPGASSPWRAQTVHDLPLGEFSSPSSRIGLTEYMLRAEGVDGQGATRLQQTVPALNAADFRYVAFDIDELATIAKLTLTWNGSEGAGSAALPDTPFGRGTVDLSRVQAWKGDIDSIGLVALPVDYLAPSAAPESALVLRNLRLESASVSNGIASLWSEWSAYRPWTGRSNNTAGLELAGGAGASLYAFLVSWSIAALILLALCFGRAQARASVLPILVGVCLVLGLLQIRQLAARAVVANRAAGLVADRPESPLAAQPQLAAAANRLSEHLDASGRQERMLVHGTGQFLSEYPTWLLRTHDAAILWGPEHLPPQEVLAGWLLVLVGQGDWEHTPASNRLSLGAQERQATLEFDAGVMKAYRFDPAQSTP